MKKGLRKIIFLMILIVVIIISYSIFAKKNEKILYLTERIKIGNIKQAVNATGEVMAVQLVTVGAQASGQIEKLYVKLGQKITKGDMIAQIDSTTQLNELNINKAQLEALEAQLAARKITLIVAKKQYRREYELWRRKAASRESLEKAQDALALALANVTETTSLIKQSEISVNTAETNLSYTKITAPLTGTVVSVPVEQGQTVNANQATPTIVQIADLSTVEIKMQISEGDVIHIKPGMEVTFSVLATPNKTYTGKLESIDPGLTTLTTGTYTGAADSSSAVYYYGNLIIANSDEALRIGMTTQNTITIAKVDNVLIVPNIAIHESDDDRTFVYVLKNNNVVEKNIVVGLSDSMNTQVVSGLSQNEEVVIDQTTDAGLNETLEGRPGM